MKRTRSESKDSFWFPLFVLLLTDGLVLFGAVMAAYAARFSLVPELVRAFPWLGKFFTGGSPVLGQYVALGLYAAFLGIFVFQRFGMYTRRDGLLRRVQPWTILSAVLVAYVFLMAFLFAYVNYRYDYSRAVVGLSLLASIAGVMLSHRFLGILQALLVSRGVAFERTIVVAAAEDVERVAGRLLACYGSRHQIRGFVVPGDDPPGIPGVLGRIEDAERHIHPERVDRVVVALPPGLYREGLAVYKLCRERGVEVRMAPALFEAVAMEISLGDMEGIPTITLGETPLTGTRLLLKQILDILVAGVLLILSLPLIAVIAILIKLDSRGPVIYRQERIGADGRLFTLFKFRTMRIDAERETGPVFASEGDPRCTRLGRVLRRCNLDELPQLLNVLRGDMAVVGPRPERPYFVNKFKSEIPGYLRRHVVKPGMTGWAQVHGFRGNTSVQERVTYDMYYIENWSLGLDIRIILRTIGAKRNAY